MEYQKIINLLISTPNQPSKTRTKNWSWMTWTYITGIQVKFKTSMMIYDDSDVYMSGTTSVGNTTSQSADAITIIAIKSRI